MAKVNAKIQVHAKGAKERKDRKDFYRRELLALLRVLCVFSAIFAFCINRGEGADLCVAFHSGTDAEEFQNKLNGVQATGSAGGAACAVSFFHVIKRF